MFFILIMSVDDDQGISKIISRSTQLKRISFDWFGNILICYHLSILRKSKIEVNGLCHLGSLISYMLKIISYMSCSEQVIYGSGV